MQRAGDQFIQKQSPLMRKTQRSELFQFCLQEVAGNEAEIETVDVAVTGRI